MAVPRQAARWDKAPPISAWSNRGPFDRMLAAQAQPEGARIVTSAPALPAFLGDGVAA